jgi:hypothetical protein
VAKKAREWPVSSEVEEIILVLNRQGLRIISAAAPAPFYSS